VATFGHDERARARAAARHGREPVHGDAHEVGEAAEAVRDVAGARPAARIADRSI
jgi:hypothetical protein